MRRSFQRDTHEVDPDEIFIDSKNLSALDTDRFEGRIEQALSKRTLLLFLVVCVCSALFYIGRVGYLQLFRGKDYAERSKDNSLEQQILYAERGSITDRNDTLLVWNELDGARAHKRIDGIAHLIGHLGFPTQKDVDTGEARDLNHLIGKDGVEQFYNTVLDGVPGVELVEHDAHGVIKSQSVQTYPRKGTNLKLSIDSAVQEELFQIIKSIAQSEGFSGGAGGIMDVRSGEMLALVSYPEYPRSFFSTSTPSSEREKVLKDPSTPFLNRPVSGLYAPGSTVKPIIAMGVLNEKVISPTKKILSTGSISIPNPYDKTKETVFKDWRANGWTDIREAIAVSSDVYFYAVGGGYKDQPGIGISAIDKYVRMFGLGSRTGIDLPTEAMGEIPSPEWKKKYFDGEEWFLGNTYHTSIGQYGFQVTVLQMLRAVAAISTEGLLVRPHVVIPDENIDTSTWSSSVDLPKSYFKIVKEGMRMAVTEGTLPSLQRADIKIAGKTGTAEIGVKKLQINSWVEGFFPYDNPRYAFVVVMEKGPRNNTIGATTVMRRLFDWMAVEKPEYIKPIVQALN